MERATRRLPALKPDLLAIDVAALGLAFGSLLVLVAGRTPGLLPGEVRWILWIDYAAIAVFAVLFVAKALVSDSTARYVRHHFFDVAGLLPITQPLFGLERWWGLVGVLIVLARLSAGLDRAFGERVLARIVERYREGIVEELTEPILVRLVGKLRDAARRGSYAKPLAAALETRRGDLKAALRRAMDTSPKLAFLRSIPAVESKLDEVADELVAATAAALASDEVNRALAEGLAGALADLEAEVAKPRWKERGLGLGDVARGLARRA